MLMCQKVIIFYLQAPKLFSVDPLAGFMITVLNHRFRNNR
jgi:hypothetical protein